MDKTHTVLIVDDQEINRQLLKKILQQDYSLMTACNGQEALKLLEQNSDSISLVLLDIVMPVLDGFGVLRAMRQQEALRGIPVIVSSQREGDETELQSLSLGASDFMSKPYKPDIIRCRVANLINLHESADAILQLERDSLTGVLNKEAFCRYMHQRLQKESDAEFDLLCIDIEHFKLVNDLFGKAEGDALLKYVAQTHTINPEDLVGRLQSDVFVCLTPHMTPEKPEEVYRYIAHRLDKYPINIKLGVKMGVYSIADRTLPAESMCDRVQLAVASIKGKFDANVAFYDDSLREKLLEEQAITDNMLNALEQEQFVIYYQPKYELATESIAGAEALVRWLHPEKGFLPPNSFIPLFEKNGFITHLDAYVWEHVCRDMKAWRDQGQTLLPISVNVSRADIYSPHLIEKLTNLISKYELPPSALHLEITESAYTENPEQLICVVSELKKRGFILEMDDFGTGYSSLNMLAQLPIHVLKLDMRFIQNETMQKSHGSILSFVISLAKWLNLSVVAEGVETRDQIETLRSMDCNFVQGYYYAKPMPRERFIQHLTNVPTHVVDSEAIREAPVFHPVLSAENSDKPLMLIVDDIELNRTILSGIFSEEFSIAEANNGQAAIEYIQNNAGRLSIILLDLVMPIMDGFQMLTRIKIDKRTAQIPVIVTSQANEDSEARALKMGAADFIAKPYHPEVAISRVHNVIAYSRLKQINHEKNLLQHIREMEERMRYDTLTHLFNRWELEESVNDYFNRGGTDCAFFLIDLDGFKSINDTLGHQRGDALLCEAAQHIKSLFPDPAVIARVGGDEFAAFLPQKLTEQEMAEQRRRMVEGMHIAFDGALITASTGICVGPENGREYKLLFNNADKALLACKRAGKDSSILYSDKIQDFMLPSFRSMEWVLDEMTDCVLIVDESTREVLYVNEAVCRHLDIQKGYAMGMKCYQLLHKSNALCKDCHMSTLKENDYQCQVVSDFFGTLPALSKSKHVDWLGHGAALQVYVALEEPLYTKEGKADKKVELKTNTETDGASRPQGGTQK